LGIYLCLKQKKSSKCKIVIFQKEQYYILDSTINVYQSKLNYE